MVKLGFSLQALPASQFSQTITLLHNAGFSAVSPVWSEDLELEQLAACVAENGMTIQSLHAPHSGIALLWTPQDPLSAATVKNITGCIDACAKFNIPLAVVHGWQGLIYTFPTEPLNFTNFDYIVDYAEEKKVSIAFENLEGEEYLEALLTRYGNRAHVGYCWDSGHDNCYPHRLDFLKAFGSRLIMTHVNDNLGLRDPSGIPSGKDDLHFLPYDGKICWEKAIERLKDLPRQEILNFELKKRTKSDAPEDLIYDGLSMEEYISLAGIRAKQIARLYEKMTQGRE